MRIQKTVFAAGCFWHIEDSFLRIKGVVKTTVGYTGGNSLNPKYKDVCIGDTGHAEAVEIEFDSAVITFSELLEYFWKIHDPCSLNKQGADVGDQYRSALFVTNPAQLKESLRQKNFYNKKKYSNNVVTKIENLSKFYPAEEYHQKYLQKKSHF